MPYDTSQMEEALEARSKMPVILGRAQTGLQAFE